jgi:hypothetical protein
VGREVVKGFRMNQGAERRKAAGRGSGQLIGKEALRK